jgi:hypothetical protein
MRTRISYRGWRTRRAANGPARVTRRAGDPVVRWLVAAWPMNVADVLAGGGDAYAERVAAWARTTIDALAAAERE